MSDFKIGDEVQIRATIVSVDETAQPTARYELAFNSEERTWVSSDVIITKINPIANNDEQTPQIPSADEQTTIVNVEPGDEVTLNGKPARVHKICETMLAFVSEEF